MMPVYAVVVRVKGSGPIGGAEVLLDGVSVGLTGADGSLTIAEVVAGPHTIEAQKEGYTPDSATISVPETTSVTLTLTPIAPPTYTVSVHVEGSGPVAGALVLFDHIVKGYTDSAGGITITDVTAGAHLIEARKGGYYDASATIDVPETTSVTLTMTSIPPPPPPTGRIYVHVTGSLHGIRIVLKDRPVYLDGALVGYTDPNGDLYITDVAEGTHSVRVVAPSGWNPPEDTKSVIVPNGSVSFYFWF